MSAANAGVPINAMAMVQSASFFITAPENMQNLTMRPAGALLPLQHSGRKSRAPGQIGPCLHTISNHDLMVPLLGLLGSGTL
jgi:hypothetical protein